MSGSKTQLSPITLDTEKERYINFHKWRKGNWYSLGIQFHWLHTILGTLMQFCVLFRTECTETDSECETVQKLTVWVVYVGVWKGKNCLHILVFCQNCQFKTEEVREEAWKEGEAEWEDAGGERWRQMRIGAQELKWPRWPDADKLPLLSTLSALPLICHCHPAALHLFPLFLFVILCLSPFCEPLLLIHDYIFMLGSIIRLFKSFYPFLKSQWRDIYLPLVLFFRCIALHSMCHSRHVQLVGNDSALAIILTDSDRQ